MIETVGYDIPKCVDLVSVNYNNTPTHIWCDESHNIRMLICGKNFDLARDLLCWLADGLTFCGENFTCCLDNSKVAAVIVKDEPYIHFDIFLKYSTRQCFNFDIPKLNSDEIARLRYFTDFYKQAQLCRDDDGREYMIFGDVHTPVFVGHLLDFYSNPIRECSRDMRYTILKDQAFKCNSCGRGLKYSVRTQKPMWMTDDDWKEVSVAHIDHIHPFADYKTYQNGFNRINERSNLQALCKECNVKKWRGKN